MHRTDKPCEMCEGIGYLDDMETCGFCIGTGMILEVPDRLRHEQNNQPTEQNSGIQ